MSYSRIIYCGGRGNNRGIFRIFSLLYSLDKYVKTKLSQKYYKGTDDPLYFPYINHDLKVCLKIKKPYYYGLKCDKIIFDEFPLPDWTKESDPSLSGKLNDITVKNWR